MRALRLADQMEILRHLLGTRDIEPAAYTIQAACNEIKDLRNRCQELEARHPGASQEIKATVPQQPTRIRAYGAPKPPEDEVSDE